MDEIGAIKVDQVCIGSCTNSSYLDLMRVASILKGKTVHPDVSLAIAPGSKQVYNMLAQNGALADLIAAGARILECACGPCIGMGQSPNSKGISLRTFNRNFEGRSGTADGQIYLVSPETAAASALTGVFTEPAAPWATKRRSLMPEHFLINDNMVVRSRAGERDGHGRDPARPEHQSSSPRRTRCRKPSRQKRCSRWATTSPPTTSCRPAPRSSPTAPTFPTSPISASASATRNSRLAAREYGKGIVIGGANYGQGSSREHAALVPLYLGVKAVIAKSFARIHCANLANAGILPLVFKDEADYDRIDQMDELELPDIRKRHRQGNSKIIVKDLTKGIDI